MLAVFIGGIIFRIIWKWVLWGYKYYDEALKSQANRKAYLDKLSSEAKWMKTFYIPTLKRALNFIDQKLGSKPISEQSFVYPYLKSSPWTVWAYDWSLKIAVL